MYTGLISCCIGCVVGLLHRRPDGRYAQTHSHFFFLLVRVPSRRPGSGFLCYRPNLNRLQPILNVCVFIVYVFRDKRNAVATAEARAHRAPSHLVPLANLMSTADTIGGFWHDYIRLRRVALSHTIKSNAHITFTNARQTYVMLFHLQCACTISINRNLKKKHRNTRQ